MMTNHKLLTSMLLAATGFASGAMAADAYPGAGIQYAAKLIFDKKDTKASAAPTSIHSGQTFNTPNDDGNPTMIPQTKSVAWCDSSVTPPGYESNGCYGWTMNSNWYLIDLSKLKGQGLSAVWVTISVARYQGAKPEENDIIPAVTVFRGNQYESPTSHWFPSELQQEPAFWGWLLTPNPFVKGDTDGFATAYTTSSKDLATLTGKFSLKGKKQDFLTIAIGGDSKDETNKHSVNYQLTVDVKQKQPAQ